MCKNLGDYEKELPERFIRPHNKYLVNVTHIEKIIENRIVLLNGKELPLAKRRKKEILVKMKNLEVQNNF
jgi:DNA-binding LytR/AlgR family response regulator